VKSRFLYTLGFALLAGTAPWPLPVVAAEIFVTNGNKISEYTTSGATVNASLVTGLSQPFGVAVSDGYLYAASFGTGTVGQYTLSGGTVNASLVTGLGAADGVAVSGNSLFVTTAGNNTVGEYDATTGAAINASLITGLSYPGPIAVSGGDVFVSQDTGTIVEYTTAGTLVDARLVTGLSHPADGIAVSGNDLFVTEFSGVIAEFDATTGALINGALVGAAALNHAIPEGIAVYGDDLFVVTGAGIGEYTTSGATVNASLLTGKTALTGIAVLAPEPATWILLAIGAAALAARGVRKRRSQV
jgi:hypothetical protein